MANIRAVLINLILRYKDKYGLATACEAGMRDDRLGQHDYDKVSGNIERQTGKTVTSDLVPTSDIL